MPGTKQLTMGPADLFDLQNDLVRLKKYVALGRMRTIAIGPVEGYIPPPNDPYINGYGPQPQRNARGRMIDLSGQWLPIGQGSDGSILVTAPLRDRNGYVALPDLVDPLWRAENWTEEEVKDPDKRDPAKDRARTIPQRLEDRTNQQIDGMPHILVFQPVERITYQPEDIKTGNFRPAEWRIRFTPDLSGYHCALTVNTKNGECHFLYGTPIFEADNRG